jgi:hypothetical protein
VNTLVTIVTPGILSERVGYPIHVREEESGFFRKDEHLLIVNEEHVPVFVDVPWSGSYLSSNSKSQPERSVIRIGGERFRRSKKRGEGVAAFDWVAIRAKVEHESDLIKLRRATEIEERRIRAINKPGADALVRDFKLNEWLARPSVTKVNYIKVGFRLPDELPMEQARLILQIIQDVNKS